MSENRPSAVGLFTAALFVGSNLAILIGGGFLGGVLLLVSRGSLMMSGLIWLGTAGGYLAKVVATTNDRAFIEQVAKEDQAFLSDRPSAKVLEMAPGLSGKYLEGFNRVKGLKESLVKEIKALPEGPAKAGFIDFLPRLDGVTTEVRELSVQMQNLDKGLSGNAVEKLSKETADLEAQAAATTDPATRAELVTAVKKKREALTHYQTAGGGVARISAQIEAIAAALQEANARVVTLAANGVDPARIAPAQEAVEDISREVKYLTQTVEETTRLLRP